MPPQQTPPAPTDGDDGPAPETFDDLIGHERALTSLRRAFESGRAHHAYLFSGPPGIGKSTAARILGRSLLCRARRVGHPCEACGPCRRTRAGTHPDWLIIEPETSFIRIETVRGLTHQLAYRPFEGGNRVAVLRQADRLTPEAANALLKTLEEPPPHSYFILVAANPASLLPTIVSRCQHIPFSALSPDQVARVLSALDVGAEPTEVSAAARFSGGSPGRALALLADPAFRNRKALYAALLDGLELPTDGTGGRLLDFGDWSRPDGDGGRPSLVSRREHTLRVLDLLKVLIRDLMLLRAGGTRAKLVNHDLGEDLVGRARQLTWLQLSAMLVAIREAEEAVFGNVTPRLVMENLAVRVAQSSTRA